MAILSEPGTHWRYVATDHCGVLVDARDYYAAFVAAAQEAVSTLFIAGWQFDSDVRLLRGADAEKASHPVELVKFLNWLCKRRPELTVHLLAWDFSPVYALERELLQKLRFSLKGHERVEFLFDGVHPSGASHHQKFVVIDGRLAFCGGIDLCASRWDDRAHDPNNPERINTWHRAFKPYHDVATFFDGRAAAALDELFRERWRIAGGGALPALPHSSPRIPEMAMLPLRASRLAIARTWCTPDERCIAEVEALYDAAIRAADALIYIETQYFTSDVVFQALVWRMTQTDRPHLSIVIVMPRGADSPKEKFALGATQTRLLSALAEVARRCGQSLRVVYSAALDASGREVPTFIHSKLLIVDDRLVSIGSANLTNRSMRLDSELNVTCEAEPGDEVLARDIQRLRASLLAEHAGIAEDQVFEPVSSLCQRIDELAVDPDSKLQLRELPAFPPDDADPLLKRLFDPGAPFEQISLEDLNSLVLDDGENIFERAVAVARRLDSR